MIRIPFRFPLTFAVFALISVSGITQERFQVNDLNSPIQNGDKVAQKFVTTEIYEYQIPEQNAVVLRNGFRKHGFVNAKDWLDLKGKVTVSKVQIVFSKYPIRNGTYSEIYPLLFNRIKATIAMDPALNSKAIPWERVWQTHCKNNAQVNELFHGVVIHYTTKKTPDALKEEPIASTEQEVQIREPLVTPPKDNPNSEKDDRPMSPVLEYMLNHPTTPDALRQTASELKTEDAEKLVLNYYREEGKSLEEGPVTNPAVQLNYMYELEVFSRQFSESEDTVVGRVLDRHPEWKEKIVINDWTGSMYGYGSQVILWHLMNLEKSGISTITLFNDGDKKTTKQKKIGKTKGIYTEETDNPTEILDLFNEVMHKGGGGDGPENDVEAILSAMKNHPNAEIILIADNSACVRDISLADEIKRPVRVILCGYKSEEGVNPDYVYLAKITGGGIYTLEDDLEQLNATLDSEGRLAAFEDGRFQLSSPQCFEDVFYAAEGREYSLKNARWNKKDVRVLNASNLYLTKVPSYVFKMNNLQALDLSNNDLYQLDDKLLRLGKLSQLEVNNNHLSDLPNPLIQLRFLEHINLNSNQFDSLPKALYQLDFLRELHANGNNLSSIEPFDSKVMEVLNLANNQLTEFPVLKNQTTLIELNVEGNNISRAPKTIPSSLEHLNLKGNPIEFLPGDLAPYQNLKTLNLQGNPIPVGERTRIRHALFDVDLTF